MTASSPIPSSVIDPALTDPQNTASPSSPSAQPQPDSSSSETNNPFPAHTAPRIWFLSAGNSPVGVVLARALLEHGDKVVAGVYPPEHEKAETRKEDFRGLLMQVQGSKGWKERFKIVAFDIRSTAECQAAVAEANESFGQVDILFCCNSETLVGSVEELAQSNRTDSLVTDQFATNFFGPVNLIKATLPTLRAQRDGHIILLTGITGHLGTPGLGTYCASQWAIEGYCDSLAYEIAPFNIKLSIVQSNIEVSILTNKLIVAPAMKAYLPPENMAPLSRGILGRMLDVLEDGSGSSRRGSVTTAVTAASHIAPELREREQKPSERMLGSAILETYPSLPMAFRQNLVAETVYAIIAIGGHENPPARHIVGHEGVASVKEKLKTVSEELEDFVEVSAAVDLKKAGEQ